MIFARVEQGAIVDGPRPLPPSWRNVAGLPNMPPALRTALGWLPVERETLGDYQRHGEPVVEPDRVHYPAVDIPIDELLQRKRGEINAACDETLAALTVDTPVAEVDTWPTQASEATQWDKWDRGVLKTSGRPATPLLDRLAASRGIAMAELVRRVLAKSATYTETVGSAVGRRQALRDQIDAIESEWADETIDEPTARAQLMEVVW